MKLDIKTFLAILAVSSIYCISLSTPIKYAVLMATAALIIGYVGTIVLAIFLSIPFRVTSPEISAGIISGAAIIGLFLTILDGDSFFFENIGGLIGLLIGSIMTLLMPPKMYTECCSHTNIASERIVKMEGK